MRIGLWTPQWLCVFYDKIPNHVFGLPEGPGLSRGWTITYRYTQPLHSSDRVLLVHKKSATDTVGLVSSL